MRDVCRRLGNPSNVAVNTLKQEMKPLLSETSTLESMAKAGLRAGLPQSNAVSGGEHRFAL